jgi:uncharacterized membrane protein (DUF2068 family)
MDGARPSGVTIAAVVSFLEGALLGMVGLLPLGRFVQLSLRSGRLPWVDGGFLLLLAALLLIFAFLFVKVVMGLWRLERWARLPAILLSVLVLLLGLTELLTLPRLGEALVGISLLVVNAWVVWYLTRTPVKEAFRG